MDQFERPVPVERLPGSGRRTELFTLLAVAVLALFVVKPWAASPGPLPRSAVVPPAPSSAPSLPSTSGSSRPAAGIPLRSPAPGEIVCQGSWELVSLSRLAEWSVREWLPALPRASSGPGDPGLTPLQLADGPVRALGVCGDQAATGTEIVVRNGWRVSPNGHASPIELLVQPDPVAGPIPDLAVLYRPAGIAASQPWPDGRYVLELATATGTGAGWVAIDIGRPAT